MTKEQKQKVCQRYSKPDPNRLVHCYECPLVVDKQNHLCKINSYYDKSKKEWVPYGVKEFIIRCKL